MNSRRSSLFCVLSLVISGCASDANLSGGPARVYTPTGEQASPPPMSTQFVTASPPSISQTPRVTDTEVLATESVIQDWSQVETATGESLLAPDGAVAAEVRSSLCLGIENPVVLHQVVLHSTSEQHTIAQFAYSCDGPVSFVPVQLLRWTDDGRYLFYTDQGGGGGGGSLCQWLRPAFRYDVAARATTAVFWEQGSYDGRYSAYRAVDGLTILDKSTGEISIKAPSQYPSGDLAWVTWSPDSHWVIYLENDRPQCLSDGASALTLVDVKGVTSYRAQISKGGEPMGAGSQVEWTGDGEFVVRTYGSVVHAYRITPSGLEQLDSLP